MSALLDVILPVFVVLALGYGAAFVRLFTENAVDGVMRFAQNFALPCLVFLSIARLDLGAVYDIGLFVSFYGGAFAGFALGFAGARYLFRRPAAESVAVGFACMFSNTLLLGLPITERAYGPEALAGNYAIISIHSPLIYTFGITLMEVIRSRDHAPSGLRLIRQILRAIFSQPLVVGVALGFVVNLGNVALPVWVVSGLEMLGRAAIPAALFGLGGVLWRYRPEGDKALIVLVCLVALVVHPAVTYALGRWGFDLSRDALRSAVVTAAMPPGVNAYLFAHLYSTGRRVAASAVLIGTALSIGTAWVWLGILP